MAYEPKNVSIEKYTALTKTSSLMQYACTKGDLKELGERPTYGHALTYLRKTVQNLKNVYEGKTPAQDTKDYSRWLAIQKIAKAYGAEDGGYEAVQIALSNLQKDIEGAQGLSATVGEQIGTIEEVEADCTFGG